ncbi:MAG: hypothetical protein WB764_09395 [Xanthobacteraceae bacterium]
MSDLVVQNGGEPPEKFEFQVKGRVTPKQWQLAQKVLASFGGLSAVTLFTIAAVSHSNRTGFEYAVECGAFVCILALFVIATTFKRDSRDRD